MIVIESTEKYIDLSFRGKLILDIVYMESWIAVYDYIKNEFVVVRSTILKGALDELEPYINTVTADLRRKDFEEELHKERVEILERYRNRVLK